MATKLLRVALTALLTFSGVASSADAQASGGDGGSQSAGDKELPREVTVLQDMVEGTTLQEFAEKLDGGASFACCGPYADPSALRFTKTIADKFGRRDRQMGEVRFEASSGGVLNPDKGEELWGLVAVLLLDEIGDGVQVTTYIKGAPELATLSVGRGDVVLVPAGHHISFSQAMKIAWLPMKADPEARGVFDFYVASGLRKYFVAPHDTAAERRFFEEHTSSGRYWHDFVWSFAGMFCTVFSLFPLVWWGLHKFILADCQLPTHVVHGGGVRVLSKRPTLLPNVGTIDEAVLKQIQEMINRGELTPTVLSKGLSLIHI